jgi:hypothetical protein
LQPRPRRFIETVAQQKRSGTGCKPVPVQVFQKKQIVDFLMNPPQILQKKFAKKNHFELHFASKKGSSIIYIL